MALWFAALLGLIQGLTEFLPISSTAHLRIAPALLGQPDPGAAFTAVIQLGTLLAVIGYFARDLLWRMPRALLFDRQSPAARTAAHLVIGSVPIAIAGVLAGFVPLREALLLVVAYRGWMILFDGVNGVLLFAREASLAARKSG